MNHSQKIITKCDGIITNCDSLVYYKVRHGLLQITTGITKCDDYYKLRQYIRTRNHIGHPLTCLKMTNTSPKSAVSEGPGRFSPFSPALWRFSPKSPISPKSPVSSHPTQIVRGWRFFAIFAILAIACISGYKWKWRGILMVLFYYPFL